MVIAAPRRAVALVPYALKICGKSALSRRGNEQVSAVAEIQHFQRIHCRAVAVFVLLEQLVRGEINDIFVYFKGNSAENRAVIGIMLLVKCVPALFCGVISERRSYFRRVYTAAVGRVFHRVIGRCGEINDSLARFGNGYPVFGNGKLSVGDRPEPRVETHTVILDRSRINESIAVGAYLGGMRL